MLRDSSPVASGPPHVSQSRGMFVTKPHGASMQHGHVVNETVCSAIPKPPSVSGHPPPTPPNMLSFALCQFHQEKNQGKGPPKPPN